MEDKDLRDLLIETQHELIKQYQDKVFLLKKLLLKSNAECSQRRCQEYNEDNHKPPINMPIEPNKIYFVPPLDPNTKIDPSTYDEINRIMSVDPPSFTSSELPIKFTLLK